MNPVCHFVGRGKSSKDMSLRKVVRSPFVAMSAVFAFWAFALKAGAQEATLPDFENGSPQVCSLYVQTLSSAAIGFEGGDYRMRNTPDSVRPRAR
jgi:hypothetical protein